MLKVNIIMNPSSDNPLHVIYDFETVDNKPSAALASAAFILFRPEELKTFDELVAGALRIKFDLKEQFSPEIGRSWNKETIDWWKSEEQADAYQKVIKPSANDVSIKYFNQILQKWLTDNGYVANVGEKIWTRGNSFDPPMLDSVWNQFGWDPCFPWWNTRDVRTEIDAVTPYWDANHEGRGYIKDFPYPNNFIKHMETHDCARDIMMMQYAHVGLCQRLNFVDGVAF